MQEQTPVNIEQFRPEARPIYDARALTDGGKQAHIQLDDKVYTLCITRAGKLILTK